MPPRAVYVDRHPARFGEFLRARRVSSVDVRVPRGTPSALRQILRSLGDVRGTAKLTVVRGWRRRRDASALVDFWEWVHSEELFASDALEACGFQVCPEAEPASLASDGSGEWVCQRSTCAPCRGFVESAEQHGVYLA